MCNLVRNPIKSQCVICQSVFSAKTKGKRFCKECADSRRAHPQGCYRCGALHARNVTGLCETCFKSGRQCKSIERRTRTCVMCGNEYTKKKSALSGDGDKCCSRKCGFDYQRKVRREAKILRDSQRSRDVNDSRYRSLFLRIKCCDVCGMSFIRRNMNEKLCSYECRREKCRIQAMISRGYDPQSKPCKSCGCEVENVSKHGVFRPPLCRSCAAQAKRISKRRAKRRRECKQTFATRKHPPVTVLLGLQKLIKEAGTRCPCCGLLMTKAIDPNNDRALELDHAMPLSKGGDDIFPNLRPMCRKCNRLKSDCVAVDIAVGEWLKEGYASGGVDNVTV